MLGHAVPSRKGRHAPSAAHRGTHRGGQPKEEVCSAANHSNNLTDVLLAMRSPIELSTLVLQQCWYEAGPVQICLYRFARKQNVRSATQEVHRTATSMTCYSGCSCRHTMRRVQSAPHWPAYGPVGKQMPLHSVAQGSQLEVVVLKYVPLSQTAPPVPSDVKVGKCLPMVPGLTLLHEGRVPPRGALQPTAELTEQGSRGVLGAYADATPPDMRVSI